MHCEILALLQVIKYGLDAAKGVGLQQTFRAMNGAYLASKIRESLVMLIGPSRP